MLAEVDTFYHRYPPLTYSTNSPNHMIKNKPLPVIVSYVLKTQSRPSNQLNDMIAKPFICRSKVVIKLCNILKKTNTKPTPTEWLQYYTAVGLRIPILLPTLVFNTGDIFYLSVLNAVLVGAIISEPVFNCFASRHMVCNGLKY